MGVFAEILIMTIFFDLDGTLIDSRVRLYKLFQELIPQSKLSFDEYWKLKRNKIDHETILKNQFNFEHQDFLLFEKKWMELIEDEQWLIFDKPFAGVTHYLQKLKRKGFLLYIVTSRQYKSKVLTQLNSFGWDSIFKDILVTEQRMEKSDLIRTFISNDNNNWIVGDTGKDIQTGKKLQINTVAVLTGFLNRNKIAEYQPDLIVNNVINIPFNKII